MHCIHIFVLIWYLEYQHSETANAVSRMVKAGSDLTAQKSRGDVQKYSQRTETLCPGLPHSLRQWGSHTYLVCTVLGQQLEHLFFRMSLPTRQDYLPTLYHCWGVSPMLKCHYQLQQKGMTALPKKLRSLCGQQAFLPSLLKQGEGEKNSDKRKGFFCQ